MYTYVCTPEGTVFIREVSCIRVTPPVGVEHCTLVLYVKPAVTLIHAVRTSSCTYVVWGWGSPSGNCDMNRY